MSEEVELARNPLVFECILRNAPWCLEEFSIAELSSVIVRGRNYWSRSEITAVQYAAALGEVECFAILVRRLGVTIDSEVLYCCDARFSLGNRRELWNWLVENGDLSFQEHSGGLQSVFNSAAHVGAEWLLSFLFTHFGEVFDVNKALVCASRQGKTGAGRLLLDHGAEVNGYGYSPLNWAAYSGFQEFVRLMLEKGANVDGLSLDGTSALHYASEMGQTDCVLLLLEHGADMTLRDGVGNTALSLAIINGHTDCVNLLHQAELEKKGKRE